MDSEQEVTHPFILSLDEALSLLEPGHCFNGCLLIAMQWLALNRHRLDDGSTIGSCQMAPKTGGF